MNKILLGRGVCRIWKTKLCWSERWHLMMPMVMMHVGKIFKATASICSRLQKYKITKNTKMVMMQIRTDSRIHLKWGESGTGKKCDWFTRQSVVSRPLLFSPSGLFAQIFLPPNPPNSLLPSFHFLHQVSGSRLCRLRKTEHHQLFEETGRFMAKPNNRWPQHVYPTLDNQNSFSFKTFLKGSQHTFTVHCNQNSFSFKTFSKEPHIATSHCNQNSFFLLQNSFKGIQTCQNIKMIYFHPRLLLQA